MFRTYSGNPKKFWLRRLAVSLSIFACLMALSHYPGFKDLFETERAMPISDVSEILILNLHRDADLPNAKRVQIRLFGEIDGLALFEPLESHASIATYPVGPGKVDLKIEIPWKEKKISVRYTPSGVKSGMLNLKYRFLK